jgi:hypothetical protein
MIETDLAFTDKGELLTKLKDTNSSKYCKAKNTPKLLLLKSVIGMDLGNKIKDKQII